MIQAVLRLSVEEEHIIKRVRQLREQRNATLTLYIQGGRVSNMRTTYDEKAPSPSVGIVPAIENGT
jgi:hypothetical protein